MTTTGRLIWERDGQDWPHREASQFICAGGLRWHLQRFACTAPVATGAPPVILLLHGTGASTHSWRGLAPRLARYAEVLSPDLPGHGFTAAQAGEISGATLSLPGMAGAMGELLGQLALTPTLVVGHSAGAAIATRMCLDRLIAPRHLIGLNAALLPLGGLAGRFFSPVAKLMATMPLVPRVFAWQAEDPSVLQRLIDSTGSQLDPTGLALYGRLVRNPGHAAGALGMMAHWNLDDLAEQLPQLQTPLSLVVGAGDRTVPPAQATQVMARLSAAARGGLHTLPGLGHLAHEERPGWVAPLVLAHLPEAQG